VVDKFIYIFNLALFAFIFVFMMNTCSKTLTKKSCMENLKIERCLDL